MQQINNVMSLVQASAKSVTPIKSERTQGKPWSASTEAMVILLFARLADLFDSKAAVRGLIVYQDREKKIYSEKLELWCRKLDDLQSEDFRRGMAGLERKAEDDYKHGAEMWPPSYAEFRALAFPRSDRDALAHKPFPRVAAIEDKTEREKLRELGREKTRELLDMLGVSKANPNSGDEDFGKARLEAAKQKLARESQQ